MKDPGELVEFAGQRVCADCQATMAAADRPMFERIIPPEDTFQGMAEAARAQTGEAQILADCQALVDQGQAEWVDGDKATPAPQAAANGPVPAAAPDPGALPPDQIPGLQKGVQGVSLQIPLPSDDYPRHPEAGGTIPGWPLKRQRLSASALKKFATCPEQFRRNYVMGEWGPTSGAGVTGSAVHAAIEAVWGWKLAKGGMPSVEAIGEVYERAWDRQVAKDTAGNGIAWRGQPDKFMAQGRAALAGYFDAMGDQVTPLVMEDRFAVQVAGCPVPIVGVIDLIGAVGGHREAVIDVKSGKQIANDTKPDWRIQGLVYLLAKQMDVRWHTVSYAGKVTTSDRNEAGPDKSVRTDALLLPLTANNYQVAANTVRNLVAAMLAYAREFGTAGPWPGNIVHQWACNLCDFQGSCPWWVAPQVETI